MQIQVLGLDVDSATLVPASYVVNWENQMIFDNNWLGKT